MSNNYANPGEFYKQAIATFCEAREAFKATAQELATAENSLRGCDYGAFGRLDGGRYSDFDGLLSSVAEALVGIAAKRFSADATPLEIDRYNLKHDYTRENRDTFDPVALWEELEATFGNGAGEALRYKQATKEFSRLFWRLGGPVEPRKVAGKFAFDLSVTCDSLTLEYHNKLELCFHSRQGLVEVSNGLRTFAEWASLPGVFAALDALSRLFNWGGSRGYFTSREKIHTSRDMDVIAYKSKIEFRISPAVAEQLQVFMGLYDPKYQEKNAA